jgi:hypothetical protein
MRVAPEAACAAKKHRRQQPRVHRNSRHSLHNGFNGFLRALPGDHAWLPPSSADCSADLAPASERQDHTTSPSARQPLVAQKDAPGVVRPSHPAPNVRDDREPPLLMSAGQRKEATDLGSMQSGIFFLLGLDDPNRFESAEKISFYAHAIFRLRGGIMGQ